MFTIIFHIFHINDIWYYKPPAWNNEVVPLMLQNFIGATLSPFSIFFALQIQLLLKILRSNGSLDSWQLCPWNDLKLLSKHRTYYWHYVYRQIPNNMFIEHNMFYSKYSGGSRPLAIIYAIIYAMHSIDEDSYSYRHFSKDSSQSSLYIGSVIFMLGQAAP